MPSRSLRMRLVQMVHARSSTAAYLQRNRRLFDNILNSRLITRNSERYTYRTAAFVRFVTETTSFPASDKRRATCGGRLAFTEGAVVLVHDETAFAVQIAFDLGTDLLVVSRIRGGVVGWWIITLRRLTSAYRATVLVLDEVAVQSTVR